MKTLGRILVGVVLSVLNSSSQDEVPLFRSTTRLVEFSLVALDKSGNPITDLRKEEVEVLEKGQRRDLAFFRFEGTQQAQPVPQPLPPGVFTNRVQYSGGPPRNVIALVLDTLNTESKDQMRVRAQLLRYLMTLSPRTRVAVYHLGSELRVLHDFTDDAAALRARISKSALQLPVQATTELDSVIREAEQLIAMFPDDPALAQSLKNQIEVEMMYNAQVRQRKVEMTLGAMNSLGAHLAGIPGRKNLVWIGGGISMLTITGAMGFGPKGDIKSHESIIRDSSRKLAQQNIALYAVDARGLTGPTDASASLRGASTLPGRGLFDRQQQAETISADPLPAAESMAEITGGRVIRNTNDPAEGMKQADNDVMGAYTLGFYAGEPDGRWHGLKVRLKRPGVKIVYREGFFAEAAGSMLAEWSDADWQSAIRNPLGSTAISIDARCGSAPGDDPQALAAIVQVEPRHLYFQQDADRYVANVEFAIAEKMPSGQSNYHRESGQFLLTAEQYGSRNPANVRYSRSWKPAPGVSSIRVLVRDRITGRYGALDMPVARIPQSSRPSQLPTQ